MPPTMLINALEAVRRRVKWLGVAYGAGIVLAVVVAALLVAVLLDYLLNLPSVPRLLVVMVALTLIGHTLWTRVLRPAMAKLTLSDIAGKLERAFPQFDDRLRSTIDFANGANPGSEAMQQRVVEQTTSLASQLDLRTAIVAQPAYYSLAIGIAAVGFLTILSTVIVSPLYRNIAIARLFLPFSEHAWPKNTRIDMLDSLPMRIAVGQRLELKMKLGKGDRESAKAIAFYQFDDGPVQQEFMKRGADGLYSVSLDARVEQGKPGATLKAWIKAGDDEKKLADVVVVPRLAIKTIEAVIAPPAYVNSKSTTTVDLASAPAVMAAGSTVSLRATFNKDLAAGALPEVLFANGTSDAPTTAPSVMPAIVWTLESPKSAVGMLVVESPIRFRMHATDVDGFSNSEFEEYELIVRPDQMPSVQIDLPRRNEERTANAVIPLQGLAEDDYGIQSLNLVVDRMSDKLHIESPMVANSAPMTDVTWTREDVNGERQRYRAVHDWDLSKLALNTPVKAGDILEYSLSATDNYRSATGKGHDPVTSGRLRITIISPEEMLNRVVEEFRITKEQLTQVEKTQSRTKLETASLIADTKEKPTFDAADRSAADRLANQQSTAAAQTKALSMRMDAIAEKLDENKLTANDMKEMAHDVKEQLNRAAEESMKDATQSLGAAQQNSNKAEPRTDALSKAQEKQAKADEQLNTALDRMSNIGSMSQTIDRIAAILAEQKEVSKQTAEAGRGNIGKKVDDLKPEDKKKLQDAADKQNKLSERTGKALEEMQKVADQLSKSDPGSSQAMNNAAKTAQSQQVQPKQQQAAQQAQQNQQAGAQQAQKGAEMGLEMMLNELREAERARLAELSKKLEELQKQVATLIRRQSGHNLDNVMAQKLDLAVEPLHSVAGDLTNLAERDPATTQPSTAVAPPALDQQGQSQELTERNTRDISKMAEQMPNGAEPSANLVRAAGKMERAIFSLKDSKLPEAYDPSQVDALNSLISAKKIVDEQKAKVDEKMADADRESVKAKYVKIKEDQEKLDSETVRIDAAKNPSGELPRGDAMALGKLPGDQGKLSDRVTSIDKDLAAVGSVVYIWANKDIARAMDDVKADLSKPSTSVPVQNQQKRIVAQLDAMIKNLATKPKESKFAQDGKGGGQCKPGPKLPAEAELRLLGALQDVVNSDTKIADAAKEKDKEELLHIGTRQGDLRSLLDSLIQKASGGENKLGPEPDKLAQLPEEATDSDIDNQELDKSLLTDDIAKADDTTKQTGLVGDRMARSRQRLALNNDPGKVTQEIQKRISADIGELIEQSRQQQQQTRNQQNKKPGEKMNTPKPADQMAQAQNQGKKPGESKPKPGVAPAQADNQGGPPAGASDLSKEIKESGTEWGALTPRVRDAVIDGADDQVIEEYRKLVEDYYKAVSSKKDR